MMKIPYKNIYDVLKTNRLIVLSVVAASLITCVVALGMVIKLHKKSVNNAFVVNSDGSVIPLKLVDQRENLKVEALAHLELFHRYFYGITPGNYKSNLDKALWLGDSSVDALYRQKKADGVYNKLLQYALVQKVIRVTPEVDIQNSPYTFEVTTIFEINRGNVTDTYELRSTGNLIRVDRNFPYNPHGLLITNFYESQLRKLSDFDGTESPL